MQISLSECNWQENGLFIKPFINDNTLLFSIQFRLCLLRVRVRVRGHIIQMYHTVQLHNNYYRMMLCKKLTSYSALLCCRDCSVYTDTMATLYDRLNVVWLLAANAKHRVNAIIQNCKRYFDDINRVAAAAQFEAIFF